MQKVNKKYLQETGTVWSPHPTIQIVEKGNLPLWAFFFLFKNVSELIMFHNLSCLKIKE